MLQKINFNCLKHFKTFQDKEISPRMFLKLLLINLKLIHLPLTFLVFVIKCVCAAFIVYKICLICFWLQAKQATLNKKYFRGLYPSPGPPQKENNYESKMQLLRGMDPNQSKGDPRTCDVAYSVHVQLWKHL